MLVTSPFSDCMHRADEFMVSRYDMRQSTEGAIALAFQLDQVAFGWTIAYGMAAPAHYTLVRPTQQR
jgi:hypothetical protein